MPAERMVLACNKQPFFPLRQCLLASRGHLSSEGQLVCLPKESGLFYPEISRPPLLILELCEEKTPVGE